MASKKTWKKRAKDQGRIADELFNQVQRLSGELAQIDSKIRETELPGPTLDDWCRQAADLLRGLKDMRGLVMSPTRYPDQFVVPVQNVPPRQYGKSPMGGESVVEALVRADVADSTHTLMTPEDVAPNSKVRDSMRVPAGEGRFA